MSTPHERQNCPTAQLPMIEIPTDMFVADPMHPRGTPKFDASLHVQLIALGGCGGEVRRSTALLLSMLLIGSLGEFPWVFDLGCDPTSGGEPHLLVFGLWE